MAVARALTCLLLAGPHTTESPELWLTVAASGPSLAPLLTKVPALSRQWPEAKVISTSDCTNLKPNLFLLLVDTATQQADADRAVGRLRAAGVTDAYTRLCRVKPQSRLAWGIPVVHESVANAPINAVNWSDADRVSELIPLGDDNFTIIERRYEAIPEDPREGRRQSVLVFHGSPKNRAVVESDCEDARVALRDGRLAISCGREVAGDHVLHGTRVYSWPQKALLREERHCRDPQILGPDRVQCWAESVDAEGHLKLQRRIVRLE